MQLLDVSDLPAPEPLYTIVNTLNTIEPGTTLKVIHRRRPCKLFEMLDSRGLVYSEYQESNMHIVEIEA